MLAHRFGWPGTRLLPPGLCILRIRFEKPACNVLIMLPRAHERNVLTSSCAAACCCCARQAAAPPGAGLSCISGAKTRTESGGRQQGCSRQISRQGSRWRRQTQAARRHPRQGQEQRQGRRQQRHQCRCSCGFEFACCQPRLCKPRAGQAIWRRRQQQRQQRRRQGRAAQLRRAGSARLRRHSTWQAAACLRSSRNSR